jgi:hypothetical protein
MHTKYLSENLKGRRRCNSNSQSSWQQWTKDSCHMLTREMRPSTEVLSIEEYYISWSSFHETIKALTSWCKKTNYITIFMQQTLYAMKNFELTHRNSGLWNDPQKDYFNIRLSSTPRIFKSFLTFNVSDQNSVRIFHTFHTLYMPRSSHPPWFDHPNNIWCGEQIMKVLIT